MDVSSILQQGLNSLYKSISYSFINFLPDILLILGLSLCAWVFASILRLITKKLLSSIIFSQKHNDTATSRKHNLQKNYINITGDIVFLVTIIFGFILIGSILNWKLFLGWVHHITKYLPNMLSAVVILLIGLLAGVAAKAVVINSYSEERGYYAAKLLQIIIVFSFIVLSIQHLGIDVTFLTTIFINLVSILCAGIAFAFTFGSIPYINNLIGIKLFKASCAIGDNIKINEISGKLIRILPTAAVIATENEHVLLPGKLLAESTLILKNETK